MEFVAIDVETANVDMASICQIGIAQFKDGTLAEEWKTYVDPQDQFDGINVSIHGIDEDVVAGSPTLRVLAQPQCAKGPGDSLLRKPITRTPACCAIEVVAPAPPPSRRNNAG